MFARVYGSFRNFGQDFMVIRYLRYLTRMKTATAQGGPAAVDAGGGRVGPPRKVPVTRGPWTLRTRALNQIGTLDKCTG